MSLSTHYRYSGCILKILSEHSLLVRVYLGFGISKDIVVIIDPIPGLDDSLARKKDLYNLSALIMVRRFIDDRTCEGEVYIFLGENESLIESLGDYLLGIFSIDS